MKIKKYIYILLFALTSAFTACSSLEESGIAETIPADGQKIRLHATIDGGTRYDEPSDDKTAWAKGDMIFFLLDGAPETDVNDKGIKAIYDGAAWTFEEWYTNAGMQDFNPAGGKVTFAMSGDYLDLTHLKPSKFHMNNTASTNLTSYAGGKVRDLLFTKEGKYTVDENGVIDIFLNFTRPMAKIHIKGAYIDAVQIRNHLEGTMPGGVDNAGGTNANYNKSKTLTLGQIVRYMPDSQTFRDASSGNALKGSDNMVYKKRPDDPKIIDAVYYGNMAPDENGDITIVMCVNARTYPGITANAALGGGGQVAYWRKFQGKSIQPGDNIYIYGPMSDEEANLWTSQAITGVMNFTTPQITLAKNQQIELKQYCKWETPAPTNRKLTFNIGTPGVIEVSEDGKTLTAVGIGSTTLTAKTVDDNESTMTVYVE